MNFIELLDCSQVVTDCVLGHLDARSLALLGACNRYLRSLTNSELAWYEISTDKFTLAFTYYSLKPIIGTDFARLKATQDLDF